MYAAPESTESHYKGAHFTLFRRVHGTKIGTGLAYATSEHFFKALTAELNSERVL
jgi:hypothetical protein